MNKKHAIIEISIFIFPIIFPIIYLIINHLVIQKFAIFEVSSQITLMFLCTFFINLFMCMLLIELCKTSVENTLMFGALMFLILSFIGIADAITLERSDDYAEYTKSLIKQSEFEECRYSYKVFKSTTENTIKALERVNNSIKECELNAVREQNDHKQELDKFKNTWKEASSDGTKS